MFLTRIALFSQELSLVACAVHGHINALVLRAREVIIKAMYILSIAIVNEFLPAQKSIENKTFPHTLRRRSKKCAKIFSLINQA